MVYIKIHIFLLPPASHYIFVCAYLCLLFFSSSSSSCFSSSLAIRSISYIYDEYNKVHLESVEDPTIFWAREGDKLVWNKKWDKVLDESKAPLYTWYKGGEMNTCYNALDIHVKEGHRFIIY